MRSRTKRKIVRGITWPFRAVGWLFVTLAYPIRMLTKRRKSRRMRNLLQGIPAMLIAVCLGTLAIAVTKDNDNIADRYRDRGTAAFKAGDFKTAKMYFERLTNVEGSSPTTTIHLAVTLESLGETRRAAAYFEKLAPERGMGHPRAHGWVGRNLLADTKRISTDAEHRKRTYAHLLRAHRGLPDDPDINLAMADYMLRTKQARSAVEYLERATANYPERLYELSLLHLGLNNVAKARQAAAKAETWLEAQLKADPSNRRLRLRLFATRLNLDKFGPALQVLRDGTNVDPEGKYDKLLAPTLVRQFDKMHRKREGNVVQRLAILRAALKHDPQHRPAVARLLNFSSGDAKYQKAVKDLLQKMLVRGHLPALSNFVLGTMAWQQNDRKNAVMHLELALKLDKSFAVAGNNLAWMLAEQEKPDLPRARQIIDTVVKQFPEDPRYLDTRGHIAVKQKDYTTALVDLQRALDWMKGNEEYRKDVIRLHQDFVTAYRGLGNESLARQHETRIGELRKEEKDAAAQQNRK